MMRAIKSLNVYTDNSFRPSCLIINNGKIQDVLSQLPEGFAGEVDDVGGLPVIPGMVDTHVHVNEPGRTDWEGFETATKAAAAGGVTTIVDMPLNCLPVTITKKAFDEKLSAVKGKTWVNCGFWGGVVPESIDDLDELLNAGVLGVKSFLIDSGIPEFPPMAKADLKKAMAILANHQVPYLIHAELDDGKAPRKVSKKYNSFLKSRPRSWENKAIDLMIGLCKEFKTPVHIVHLSSSDALLDIKKAKAEGVKLSVESCPHYLTLASENIKDGKTLYKCCPPIREDENRQKLWQALKDDVIDFIVSDHSPCTANLKLMDKGDLDKAWGGIASLQFSLPILWTEAEKRKMSIGQLITWLCERPANFLGLKGKKGMIEKGADADLVVWDPSQNYNLSENLIHFKNKVTPYLDQELSGRVMRTYIAGELIYSDGKFMGSPRGELVLR